MISILVLKGISIRNEENFCLFKREFNFLSFLLIHCFLDEKIITMSLCVKLNNGEWQKYSTEYADDFNPNTSFIFNEP